MHRVRLTVCLVLIVAAPCGGTAAAQEPAVESFHFETGEFTVGYEPTAGTITIRHRDHPAALVTHLAAGELFEVTSPEHMRSVTVTRGPDVVRAQIEADRDWAAFRGLVEVYPNAPGLVRLRLDATTSRSIRIADGPPELRFAAVDPGSSVPGSAEVYRQQGGIEAPVAYLHHPGFGASLVYLQNLTAINPYFDQVQGDPRYTIRVDNTGVGFRRPLGTVPEGFSFTVSDAYLWLSPDKPEDDFAQSAQYLQAISDIYDRLPKPPTVYTDWPFEMAPSTSVGLLEPLNSAEVAGTRLLRAYVGDMPRQVESIVNFDVLVPALKYAQMFGADENTAQLIDQIERGVRYWYVPVEGGKMTVADLREPPPEIDAWYYVYPIVQTADLALLGNADAKEMLLGSLPKLIELGHAFDYEFPFRLDPVTNTRADDRFREYDVLGGYAYVMLTAHEITGESMYLEEAKRAVEQIPGKGFDFVYQVQLTGVTLDALAWLYELTGDERYIELSIIPLANIFALAWLWEPDYGFAKHYSLFMGTVPLPSSDQVAAFEIHNTWWSLQRFYQRTEQAQPAHIRKLLAEMIKYKLTLGRYTFPRYLPNEALSRVQDWGVLRPDLDIPVEDLKDGFNKSAMVGQEIYGAGIAYRYAGEAYRVLGNSRDLILFAEYPITESTWSDANQTLTFRIGGTPEYRSNVRVQLRGERRGDGVRTTVQRVGTAGEPGERPAFRRSSDVVEFSARGGSSYQVVFTAGETAPASFSEDGMAGEDVPTARVAGILGAGGVAQVEVGKSLSIPIVVSNPSNASVNALFEADLPAGWSLERAAVDIAPGEEAELRLRVRAGPEIRTDSVYPLTVQMRTGDVVTKVIQTLVRGVDDTDETVGETFHDFQVVTSNGLVSEQSGLGYFSTTQDGGAAAFRTRTLTVDVDRFPYLDFHVDSIAGTWAVKVYAEEGSRWGTYVLPEMPHPHVPEAQRTGWFRVWLPERTGWSGIHSFQVQLFVVGPAGNTLRLREWRLAGATEDLPDGPAAARQ